MIAQTTQTITLDSEQLAAAAAAIAEKFDLDPSKIDVLKWLERQLDSMLTEADYFVKYASDVPMKRG